MGRKVLVACDDTPHSRAMVDVAFLHVVRRPTDVIHLATVLPAPPSGGGFPLAPMATAAAVVAVHQNADAQKQAEVEKGKRVLQLVTDLIAVDYHVPRGNVHAHVLPSEGGASGVSEALLHLAKSIKADILVVGHRGLGTVQSSILSLVGLGSVSDALLKHAPCPLLVVRSDHARQAGQTAEAVPPPLNSSKRVCVAVDESSLGDPAVLTWALDNVLRLEDHLHVVSVALPPSLLALANEDLPLTAMQSQATSEQVQQSKQAAVHIVDKAVELAVSQGVTRTKIASAVLTPSAGHGSNELGQALVDYARDRSIDVMVVGSRGMGAVQRHLMSMVGLGSVSQFLSHHVDCALAVVRDGLDVGRDLARASENVAFHVIPEKDDEANA